MGNTPRLSAAAPYQPAASSHSPEGPSVGGAAPDTSTTVDSTARRSLGSGSFSLFGIKLNLFGSPRTTNPPTTSDGLISTESSNGSGTNTQSKLSLSQKISSFFFGLPTTDSSSAQGTKESDSSLLSWFSKMFGSREITFGDHDGPTIPERGSWKFTAQNNPAQINVINTNLSMADFKKIGDVVTFENDAGRTASHTLKGGFFKQGLSTLSMSGTTPDERHSRVQRALQIISDLSYQLFPYPESETQSSQATNLKSDLQLLNPQGLMASAMYVFNSSETAPEGKLFAPGGFNGNVTYAQAGSREITITIKGNLSSPSEKGSVLFGKLNGSVASLPSENDRTTGTIEMTLKAQVGDDGHITSLTCQSAKGTYQIHQNPTSDVG